MKLVKSDIQRPSILTSRQAYILECIFKMQTLCDGIQALTSNEKVMGTIRKESTLNASASLSKDPRHQQVEDMLYSQCNEVMDHLCDTLNAWASRENSCMVEVNGSNPLVV